MADPASSRTAVPGASKRLAIFRAGKHVSVDGREINFSAADVADLAASYDPAVHEAPIVIGHPKINGPAWGWGKSLSVDDQGVVWAEPHQVEPTFAEAANAGRYKKISASIYMPDTPGNPKPGRFYLRHIGFLGAAPPAVKGLPSAEFTEDDAALEFADSGDESVGGLLARLVSRLTARDAVNEIAQSIADDQVGDPAAHYAEREAARTTPPAESTETDMSKETTGADFAEQTKQLETDREKLKAKETEIAEREKKIKDAEAKEARTASAQFADQLVGAGKILPRHKDGIVELQLALTQSAPVSFSEGGEAKEKPAVEVLKAFLADLPSQVDFAEKSRATAGAETAAADFAAPSGTQADPSRMDLHAKAKEYQRTHKDVSFAEAVKACGG